MTNKQIEFTTLRELKQDLGLVIESSQEIQQILDMAKPEENKFFIGTNVYSWLSRFQMMDVDSLEERFNNYDDETEVSVDNALNATFKVIAHDNTYNFCGNSNTDIDFKILQDEFRNVYAYVRIHLGGDIRGNYAKGILIDLDTYDSDYTYAFFDCINEMSESAYVEYKGTEYCINGDITTEGLSVYNYNTDEDYRVYNFVYCDNLEDFNKECIEIVKEALNR